MSRLLISPEKRLTAAQQMGSGQTTHTDENVGSCGLTDSSDGSHVEEGDGSVEEVGEHEVVHLPARAEPDQLSPDVAQPGEDKGRDPKDCVADAVCDGRVEAFGDQSGIADSPPAQERVHREATQLRQREEQRQREDLAAGELPEVEAVHRPRHGPCLPLLIRDQPACAPTLGS